MLTSKMIGILESKYEDLQKLIGSLLVIEAEKRTFKVEELSGLINENFLFSFIHMLEEAGGLKVIRDDFDPRLKEYDIDGRNLKVILYESEILKNYLESLKCQAALNNRFEIVGNVPSEIVGDASRHCGMRSIYGAINELFCDASESMYVLNPFFDKRAINLMKDMFVNALTKGVNVNLIVRELVTMDRNSFESVRDLLELIKERDSLDKFKLYEFVKRKSDNFSVTGFHAKLIVIDGGRKAYIGSANLTGYGLLENMELGVLIEGPKAEVFYKLLRGLIKHGYVKRLDNNDAYLLGSN